MANGPEEIEEIQNALAVCALRKDRVKRFCGFLTKTGSVLAGGTLGTVAILKGLGIPVTLGLMLVAGLVIGIGVSSLAVGLSIGELQLRVIEDRELGLRRQLRSLEASALFLRRHLERSALGQIEPPK